ncbi:GTP-binding protein Rhes-like [Lampetra fluviatilis]
MMSLAPSREPSAGVPAKNAYRMVVLGASKVGKTALVSRFLLGRFEDAYTPTIEDFHRKLYRIRGELYQLDILDTSGNHPFPAMRRLCLLTGDLFVVVFSLDSRASFEEAKQLRLQILETKACLKAKRRALAHDACRPLVLCGNKGDRGDACREVPRREAEELVEGDVAGSAYFEISAKRNTGVDEMFQALFALAGLPGEMSPALHRKLSVSYCELLARKSLLQRRKGRRRPAAREGGGPEERPSRVEEEEACGAITPFARRPSVNSDLMYIREKALGNPRDRCVVQ